MVQGIGINRGGAGGQGGVRQRRGALDTVPSALQALDPFTLRASQLRPRGSALGGLVCIVVLALLAAYVAVVVLRDRDAANVEVTRIVPCSTQTGNYVQLTTVPHEGPAPAQSRTLPRGEVAQFA